MKKQTFSNEQMDFEKLFQELYEKAREVNPALLGDIDTYSDSKVSLENYQIYLTAINQMPISTTSNSVIPQQ